MSLAYKSPILSYSASSPSGLRQLPSNELISLHCHSSSSQALPHYTLTPQLGGSLCAPSPLSGLRHLSLHCCSSSLLPVQTLTGVVPPIGFRTGLFGRGKENGKRERKRKKKKKHCFNKHTTPFILVHKINIYSSQEIT